MCVGDEQSDWPFIHRGIWPQSNVYMDGFPMSITNLIYIPTEFASDTGSATLMWFDCLNILAY